MTTGGESSSRTRASNAANNKGKRKRVSFTEDTMANESNNPTPPQRQSSRINPSRGIPATPAALPLIETKNPQQDSLGTSQTDLAPIDPGNALCQFPRVPVQPHHAAAYRDETRRSSTSDRTFENLGNWSLFLRDSRDEAELAQYLGLQHKHDLRHFALSWPVIKTWIRAPHEQTSALKGEINRLIQDNKDDFSSIEDPYEVWPQQDQESVEQASVRRTHIMAWHLLQMSKDTEEYIRSSDVQNFYRTRRFRGELAEILELDMPLDLIFHPRPQLTSWRNELVEKFDRCWTILAYVSWIPYMISWEKTLEYLVSTTTKAIIYDTKMLTSTRPRPSHLGFFQTSSQGQNPIVPIQVRVNWERDKNSLEKVGLRHLLAKIAQDGRSFPPTDQILTWDPRQCKRGSSFRDNIRRAMSCSIFGFNLCDMALLYQSDTEHTFYEINTFRIQWKVLKGIFSDPDNSNFVIRVVLDIHDPRNGDIYETTELPPVN